MFHLQLRRLLWSSLVSNNPHGTVVSTAWSEQIDVLSEVSSVLCWNGLVGKTVWLVNSRVESWSPQLFCLRTCCPGAALCCRAQPCFLSHTKGRLFWPFPFLIFPSFLAGEAAISTRCIWVSKKQKQGHWMWVLWWIHKQCPYYQVWFEISSVVKAE